MLTHFRLEELLERFPRMTLGVVGDLFLDRYLDIDARLTEPSIETGLDAYQVVRVRPSPGAAGTVINNLVALGVGRVYAISAIGDDGEGYELRCALDALRVVDREHVFLADRPLFRTPTYTKPMLHQAGQPIRELNRLDIKNRLPLPAEIQERVLRALSALWPRLDALLVMDQVGETDCGAITGRTRDRLAELADADAHKVILADSRERIGLFRSVWLKPNQAECMRAVGADAGGGVAACVQELARRAGRPVFCTNGAQGMWVAEPRRGAARVVRVPAYPVAGPIDIVGAGDSTSAGLTCALAAGASLEEAAAFGNLVASITIQQIGTTGTASPDQVRNRWQELHR